MRRVGQPGHLDSRFERLHRTADGLHGRSGPQLALSSKSKHGFGGEGPALFNDYPGLPKLPNQ